MQDYYCIWTLICLGVFVFTRDAIIITIIMVAMNTMRIGGSMGSIGLACEDHLQEFLGDVWSLLGDYRLLFTAPPHI